MKDCKKEITKSTTSHRLLRSFLEHQRAQIESIGEAKDGNWFKQLGEYQCNTGSITSLAVKSMKNFDEFDEKPLKILKRKFPNKCLKDKFKYLATIVAGDRNGSLVVLDVMK